MKNDPLLEFLGIKLMVVVAGFLGGVIQLSWNRNLSVWGAVVSVLAGVCSASFVTPMINWYYSLPIPMENGVAFLLGLLGMLLSGKMYQFASQLTVERILGLFTAKRGGGNE
jgi:xanthosine utilization system XapX-like protein